MKIYHGGSVAVEHPKIIDGTFTKDFGPGFYCTKLKRQAQRWALRKPASVVSIYEYKLADDLKVLNFIKMDDEWLNFIVDCRRGVKHNYDIVIGAMANDQIYNYVNDFMEGTITREQFWVLAKFKYPTHQICFATERSLLSLTYKGAQIVKK